jgi:RNA polymerase sigma factor (sigma-70 family)
VEAWKVGEKVNPLWRRYFETRDDYCLEGLLAAYRSYLLKVVRRHARTLHRSVPFDGLLGAGLVGLWKAARRYDGRGPFEAYAWSRIVGEMRDWQRQLDWVPRRHMRDSAPAIFSLDMELGRADHCFDLVDDDDSFKRRIAACPPRERGVLMQYYARGRSQKEIAVILGLSEARISQLRKLAIRRCSRRLESA